MRRRKKKEWRTALFRHFYKITLEEEQQPVEAVKLAFAEEKQDFPKRSLLITNEHWERLQKVYDKYPVMGK